MPDGEVVKARQLAHVRGGAAGEAARFVAVAEGVAEALADWIAAETWPYHGSARPTRAQVLRWVEDGDLSGPDNRAFWILAGRADAPAGLLVLHELTDLTPVFDLRIRAACRGRGLGRQALTWLARYLFTETDRHRVEAHTRADNAPMRRLLRASGWVMEAYYRRAWPDDAGRFHDAVAYALLKDDWERGTQTPIAWDPF